MTMSATPERSLPKTRRPGWYIPWIFFAFFALVIGVNGVMIYFATSTFNGLETEGHYMKGIRYNDDLAGARAQAARGWKVDFAFKAAEEAGKGRMELTLHDKYGNLLQDAAVTVRFIRPTMQGYDQEVTPDYAGEGRYVAAVTLPLSGVWDMRLSVEHAAGDYQDQQRIWVK